MAKIKQGAKSSQQVRFHVDVLFDEPLEAPELKQRAAMIEGLLVTQAESGDIANAHVTQIIPREPNFDWRGL